MVQHWLPGGAVDCTLRLNGMTASFVGGTGPAGTISLTVPRDGWHIAKTTGTQAYQGGLAALTCNDYVYANLTYSYYARGGVSLAKLPCSDLILSSHFG